MRSFGGVLALVAITCLGTAAGGAEEEAVPLALKFSAGEVVNYEVSITGSGGVRSPEGETAAAGIRGAVSVSSRVTGVKPDGSGKLEVRVPRASIEVTIGEEKARFSYENGRLRWFANGKEHSPPAVEPGKLPLFEIPVTMTVAPDGQVSEVGIADPELMQSLEQSLPGGRYNAAQSTSKPIFPDRPVMVGETWRDSTQVLPMGPSMPITVTSSRTLDSFTEQGGIGLAKISGFSEVRMRGSPPALPAAGGVNVSVPQMRLTVTSTEFLNTTAGKLVRAEHELSFSTQVSMSLEGEEKSGGVEARLHVGVQSR